MSKVSAEGESPRTDAERWSAPLTMENDHLPSFGRSGSHGMLGSGLRHRGIECNGEVIATVWNHHHSEECDKRAMLIASAPEQIAALTAARAALAAALGNVLNMRGHTQVWNWANDPVTVSAFESARAALAEHGGEKS